MGRKGGKRGSKWRDASRELSLNFEFVAAGNSEDPRTPDLEYGGRLFQRYAIDRDGNCLFRAVSFAAGGNQSGHADLRREVVNDIVGNWDQHSIAVCAVHGVSTKDAYRKLMSRPGAFASEIEALVGCKIHGIGLRLFRQCGGKLRLCLEHEPNEGCVMADLVFSGGESAGVSNGHFDVLLRR